MFNFCSSQLLRVSKKVKRCCGRETDFLILLSFSTAVCAAPHTYDQKVRESERTLGNNQQKKKASSFAGSDCCVFQEAVLGLSRVYRGQTDRQWLHSNLWGGSFTVLFLAPHSRVSVSCGSYQLPGLMIGPQPSLPPCPHRGVSVLLSH